MTSVRPARVMRQGRGAWQVHDGTGEVLARARRRSLSPIPVTGDWVMVSGAHEAGVLIEQVLPRRTSLARVEAGRRSVEQVIAANIDIVGICTPADHVSVRRLERELTAIWSSGASPLVIVTKSDLVDEIEDAVSTASAVSLGVDVLPVCAPSGSGVPDVAARLSFGVTLALIGPSGVGKTSLVNALLGSDLLATADVRADGKGRHTTTSRELVAIPSGGLLLDTPGMREFAPWAEDEGLAGAFSDIEALAVGCRFSDCGHDSEPGCAVLLAADGDPSMAERLHSWRALQRELAWLERRHDARLMAEEGRRWASIIKSARHRIRP